MKISQSNIICCSSCATPCEIKTTVTKDLIVNIQSTCDECHLIHKKLDELNAEILNIEFTLFCRRLK